MSRYLIAILFIPLNIVMAILMEIILINIFLEIKFQFLNFIIQSLWTNYKNKSVYIYL